MCEFLSEDIKTSDSKSAQLKKWNKRFSWKRDKHKYIITEIHNYVEEVKCNEPKVPKKRGRPPKPKTEEDLLPKVPKKRGRPPKPKTDEPKVPKKRGRPPKPKTEDCNKNKWEKYKYLKHIEPLLVHELSKHHFSNYIFSYTPRGWFIKLGLANENYPQRRECRTISQRLFFDVSYLRLRQILRHSLEVLQKNKIINCSNVYFISKDKDYRVATQEENTIIDLAFEEVLSSEKYSFIKNIYLSGKYRQYLEDVTEVVKLKIDLDFFYKGIEVQLLGKLLTLNDEEFNSHRNKLNKKVKSAIEKAIKARYSTEAIKLNEEYSEYLEKDDWGELDMEDFLIDNVGCKSGFYKDKMLAIMKPDFFEEQKKICEKYLCLTIDKSK